MSTFDTFESSTESSRPIELYEINFGPDTFRYTSAEDTLTVDSNDFTPISIGRGSIAQDSEDRSRTLTVNVPSNNEFATQYANNAPSIKATISIFRLQRDEVPTFNTKALFYKGEVQNVGFSDDGLTADIVTRSIEGALDRNIPRFSYSAQCNHSLYDLGCGVNPDLFNFVGNVAVESGRTITLTGANGEADGYWTAGYAVPVGVNDFRLIIAHSGNDLTLLLPFNQSVLGTQVQIFAGCNHVLTGDCAQKFDNVLEFGGYAFGPKRNPYADGVKA